MASKYWIKLYHEILDDPKMGRLSDRSFRRTIQLFLLAGEFDDDGYLPDLNDIAWRLRCDPEELETEMIELQNLKILSKIDGRWFVTKFQDRQAPVSGAERVARYRERKRKDEYYETETERHSNEGVTKRYTDTDKIRIDEIRGETRKIPSISYPSNSAEAIEHPDLQLINSICGVWPGSLDWEAVIDSVNYLRVKYPENLIEQITPYWIAWSGRKTKNGKPYSTTNFTWLTEWAVLEQIPAKSGEKPAQKMPGVLIGHDDE